MYVFKRDSNSSGSSSGSFSQAAVLPAPDGARNIDFGRQARARAGAQAVVGGGGTLVVVARCRRAIRGARAPGAPTRAAPSLDTWQDSDWPCKAFGSRRSLLQSSGVTARPAHACGAVCSAMRGRPAGSVAAHRSACITPPCGRSCDNRPAARAQIAVTSGGELLAVSDPLYISDSLTCSASGSGQARRLHSAPPSNLCPEVMYCSALRLSVRVERACAVCRVCGIVHVTHGGGRTAPQRARKARARLRTHELAMLAVIGKRRQLSGVLTAPVWELRTAPAAHTHHRHVSLGGRRPCHVIPAGPLGKRCALLRRERFAACASLQPACRGWLCSRRRAQSGRAHSRHGRVRDRLTLSHTCIHISCRRAQGLSTGVVYLYRRGTGPGSYVLSQRLTANASAVTGFAAAIALAADGSVLLASQADDAADGSGAAYPTLTFVDVGNRTMQPGGPLPVPGGLPPGARFGQALALAGDGSQVLPGDCRPGQPRVGQWGAGRCQPRTRPA